MLTIDKVREIIENNVERIALLGEWPEAIDSGGALLKRIPSESKKAMGFDAGIAAALDLIPRDKQKLIAVLHAAYSQLAIEQIRAEAIKMLPHTETCWWLSAGALVTHEKVDVSTFLDQINDFELLQNDALLRRDIAIEMYNTMVGSFKLIDGVPFAIQSKGLQGAYLAGHRYAVQYEEEDGLFYLGTYCKTLGLEKYEWAGLFDNRGNPANGPIFGSHQFVKTPSFKELSSVLKIVISNFPPE